MEKVSILVVDDEKALVESAIKPLFRSYEKYEFDHAITLEDAVKRIETNDYDLVLLDILMGNQRGTDLIPLLQEKQLKVALCTASALGSELSKAQRLGIKQIIHKPFGSNLKIAIDEILVDEQLPKQEVVKTALPPSLTRQFLNLGLDQQKRLVEQVIYKMPSEMLENLRDTVNTLVYTREFDEEPRFRISIAPSPTSTNMYWTLHEKVVEDGKIKQKRRIALDRDFAPEEFYGLSIEDQLRKILSWSKAEFAQDRDFIEASRRKLTELGWDRELPFINHRAEPQVAAQGSNLLPQKRKIKLF
ncbi:response regulator [Merismopedia glauca]|uniref:response regulator n=1 Tax=Merismopedia glauca TaxID=292586 RepID=UPI0015E6340A|nr:response regulator [Merismopedia glauca]